jgi:hypothetical protein
MNENIKSNIGSLQTSLNSLITNTDSMQTKLTDVSSDLENLRLYLLLILNHNQQVNKKNEIG